MDKGVVHMKKGSSEIIMIAVGILVALLIVLLVAVSIFAYRIVKLMTTGVSLSQALGAVLSSLLPNIAINLNLPGDSLTPITSTTLWVRSCNMANLDDEFDNTYGVANMFAIGRGCEASGCSWTYDGDDVSCNCVGTPNLIDCNTDTVRSFRSTCESLKADFYCTQKFSGCLCNRNPPSGYDIVPTSTVTTTTVSTGECNSVSMECGSQCSSMGYNLAYCTVEGCPPNYDYIGDYSCSSFPPCERCCCSYVQVSTTTTTVSVQCTDDDGGNNQNVYGLCHDSSGANDETCYLNQDTDRYHLFEEYCLSGTCRVADITCPSVCDGGRCKIPVGSECYDTDGGRNYAEKGTVYDSFYTSGQLYDYCGLDSSFPSGTRRTLKEQTCDSGTVSYDCLSTPCWAGECQDYNCPKDMGLPGNRVYVDSCSQCPSGLQCQNECYSWSATKSGFYKCWVVNSVCRIGVDVPGYADTPC